MLRPNLGLIAKRQARDGDYDWFFVTDCLMVDGLFSIDNKGREQLFPLFLHADASQEQGTLSRGDESNLSPKFVDELLSRMESTERASRGLLNEITPEEIFHYAYAVFHCPCYRSRYVELLKIDFPRLPLTGNLVLFRRLESDSCGLNRF